MTTIKQQLIANHLTEYLELSKQDSLDLSNLSLTPIEKKVKSFKP